MVTVGIKHNGMKGTVSYDEQAKRSQVSFEDGDIRSAVEDYLATEREFNIPESEKIDDYRVDTALPTDSLMYFELAMCSLWSSTGVWVDWSTENKS